MTDDQMKLLAEAREMLNRYWREVPLGHQPHMIAADAESLVSSIDRCLASGDRNARRLKRIEKLLREPSDGMISAGLAAEGHIDDEFKAMSAALLAQVEKEIGDE